MATEFMI